MATEWVTIKVSRETRDDIDKLAGLIARHGWRKFGVKRDDLAGIGTVVAEAVRAFAAKERVK